ncbi:ferredoxin [Mycobacterium sp. 852013-50091_SCH5140682]|uniref:PDR/VanB family oxidoreductase n=1 Tax=Mycobacterium sp. 852013-50091_SCH5140682 TaxID=1834109 RepID=UPI0007EAF5D2|nr:PDR/VanB family oxidoreductase [Mycobacterium sp. 852013-50091_SCH5140682]OBC01787.1 ferredoxin [Mycobacterium sp. 852013-50091_SCH5140682]
MNTLVVSGVRQEADGVRSFRLQRPDGKLLEPWTPGAHLEFTLPSGSIRHYSLCGDFEDRTGYTVAVLEQPAGRGGSTEFHRDVREGTVLQVSPPRNHFPLVDAKRFLFVAGGIGITPILPMVRSVAKARKAFRVVYGGRTRSSMAYRDEICEYGPAAVLVPEDEAGRMDITAELAGCPAGTLVYCCGPESLLAAVAAAVEANGHVGGLHVERFGPAAGVTDAGGRATFEVELAKAGVTVTVDEGSSILDKVLQVVPGQPWACREGYCGTCETRVIAGEPQHADDILSPQERAANDVMMICVGRSRSPRLVLDI